MDAERRGPRRSQVDAAVAGAPSHLLSPLLGAGLDDLLQEVRQRVDELVVDQHRLHLLLDAVVALAANLSLDVLHRIVEVACKVSGARYAALGVLGVGSERRLQAFVTHGVTEAERRRIGDLPRGRGLLGEIIDQPVPLHLHDLAEPASSYGFPANHPPMRSFLGVPIRIRDKVFGNLYLTEKAGGEDFTDRDEAAVVALAAAAGVVIENARLYEEAARRERWLGATAEISNLLSVSGDSAAALQVVSDRARELANADVACLALRRSATELEIRTVSGAALGLVPATPIAVDGSLAGRVVSTGEVLVVEDVEGNPRSARELRGFEGWPTLGPAIVVPLRTPTAGPVWGRAPGPCGRPRDARRDVASDHRRGREAGAWTGTRGGRDRPRAGRGSAPGDPVRAGRTDDCGGQPRPGHGRLAAPRLGEPGRAVPCRVPGDDRPPVLRRRLAGRRGGRGRRRRLLEGGTRAGVRVRRDLGALARRGALLPGCCCSAVGRTPASRATSAP